MQHESKPLRRRERFQHHQQRCADGVGHLCVPPMLVIGDRFRHVRTHWFLAPRFARAQHVEADAGDDRGQPTPEVFDRAGIGTAQPQPGFLHGIIDLAGRTQHAVGHRPQMGPVGLESLSQKLFLVHRSHSHVAFRHGDDERKRADVTANRRCRVKNNQPYGA
ncbi:hypothetical protein V1290_004772 [Bradyrhizobium sp. AZCC 1578]